jgi:hypothetical protein
MVGHTTPSATEPVKLHYSRSIPELQSFTPPMTFSNLSPSPLSPEKDWLDISPKVSDKPPRPDSRSSHLSETDLVSKVNSCILDKRLYRSSHERNKALSNGYSETGCLFESSCLEMSFRYWKILRRW